MGKRSKTPRASVGAEGKSWVEQDAVTVPALAPSTPKKQKAPKVGKTPKKQREAKPVSEDVLGRINALTEQLSSAKESEKRSKKDLKRANEQLTALTTNSEAVQQKMLDLQRKTEDTLLALHACERREEVQRSENAVITKDFDSYRTNRDMLCNENEAKLHAAEKDLKSKTKKHKQITAENAQLRDEIASLHTQQQDMAQMHAQIDQHQTRITELTTSLDTANEEKEHREVILQEQIASLKERVDTLEPLKRNLAKAEQDYDTVAAELADTTLKMKTLTDDLNVANTTNDSLEKELFEAKEQLELYSVAEEKGEEMAQRVKEERRLSVQKDKRIETLKVELHGVRSLLEKVGEEKADRDARITELELLTQTQATQAAEAQAHTQTQASHEAPQPQQDEDDFCGRMSRGCSLAVTPKREKSCSSRPGAPQDYPLESTLPCTPSTPRAQVTSSLLTTRACSEPSMRSVNTQVSVSRRRQGRLSVPTVVTPKRNTAPALYAQTPTREDRKKYKLALDEQINEQNHTKKAAGKRKAEDADFFNFGSAGSGAPIRDTNNEVVTNVTFTRSNNYLPVDHPPSCRKPKRARHF